MSSFFLLSDSYHLPDGQVEEARLHPANHLSATASTKL